MGLIGYLFNYSMFFMNILKSVSGFYFIADSVNEICFNNRFIYIPHHILSLFLIVNIKKYHDLNNIFLMFFYSEITSFIINIRTIMKQKKKLNFKLDLIFYIIYFLARVIGMPISVYKTYSYKLLFYGGTILQIMSLFWIYKWTKSILKHHFFLKKQDKLNIL